MILKLAEDFILNTIIPHLESIISELEEDGKTVTARGLISYLRTMYEKQA